MSIKVKRFLLVEADRGGGRVVAATNILAFSTASTPTHFAVHCHLQTSRLRVDSRRYSFSKKPGKLTNSLPYQGIMQLVLTLTFGEKLVNHVYSRDKMVFSQKQNAHTVVAHKVDC